MQWTIFLTLRKAKKDVRHDASLKDVCLKFRDPAEHFQAS